MFYGSGQDTSTHYIHPEFTGNPPNERAVLLGSEGMPTPKILQ